MSYQKDLAIIDRGSLFDSSSLLKYIQISIKIKFKLKGWKNRKKK